MKREVLASVAGLSMLAGSLLAAETPAAAQTKHTINANVLPGRLPEDVAKNIGAIVGEHLIYDTDPGSAFSLTSPYDNSYYDSGSAVRISKNLYLAAGHTEYESSIYQSTAQEQSMLARPCANFFIDIPTTDPVKTYGPYGRLFNLTGVSVPVDKIDGSYLNDNDSTAPDIAILQDQGVNFQAPSKQPAQPKIEIAPQPPKIGQPVYFVNFETLNGIERSPSESVVQTLNGVNGNYNPALYPGEFTHPAIFGGIFLGTRKDGFYTSVGGSKSYDKQGDTIVTPEGSGGAVLNSKGQLIGLSVAGTTAADLYPIKAFENEEDVHLRNFSRTDLLQDETIQPVTDLIVTELEQKLDELTTGCSASVPGK
jgi:hypothetical protein